MRASEGARAPRSFAPAAPERRVPHVRFGCAAFAAAFAVMSWNAAPPARAEDSTSVRRDSVTVARDSATVARDSVPSLPLRLVAVADLIANGAASGELVEPAGLAIDSFGRIYVGDLARHRVLRLAATGALLGQTGSLGSAEGELRRPSSIALLGTLSVAVLDTENRRVMLYDLNDRLQGTLIDFDQPAYRDVLGRVEPRSLAADRGGALYVADSERDRLLAFDFSGRLSRVIGGFGEAPGSFRELVAVAATRRGMLVTVERAKRRVQRLDPAGVPVTAWTFADSGAVIGDLAVAADDSLNVAIADESAGTVSVWDRNGARLAVLTGLDRPRALAFGSDGVLVVAEAGPGRVRRFRLERNPPLPAAEK